MFYTVNRAGDRMPAQAVIAARLDELVTLANITPEDVTDLLSGVSFGVDTEAIDRLVGAVEGLGVRRLRSVNRRASHAATAQPGRGAVAELDARFGGDT